MCMYGDIYIANKNITGDLHRLKQTVLVVSDDRDKRDSQFITVIPIIDADAQGEVLSYVFIDNYGMSEKNIAVIEQMTNINKTQILIKVGSIQGTVYAKQVKQAIKKHFGL